LNPKIYWHIILILLLLCCCSTSDFAQHATYYQFNTENGLPSNETYKIIEDRNGYIWIATDRGIAKYDGYNFQVFTTEDGLTNNVIFWIYEDHKGRIWFSGMDNSLCYYENGKITKHPASDQLKSITNNIIVSIQVTLEDIVWIGSRGTKPILKLFPDGDIEEVEFDISSGKNVITYQIDKSNSMFGIYTLPTIDSVHKKLYLFDENHRLSNVFEILPTEFSIHSLLRFEDTVYFANGPHLYAFKHNESSRVSITEEYITNSLFRDNNKNLWVGIKRGGVRCFGDSIEVSKHEYLAELSVSSILQDREDSFWFSTTESGVFYHPAGDIKNLGLLDHRVTTLVPVDDCVLAATSTKDIYKIELLENQDDAQKRDSSATNAEINSNEKQKNLTVTAFEYDNQVSDLDITLQLFFNYLSHHTCFYKDSLLCIYKRQEIILLDKSESSSEEHIILNSKLKSLKAIARLDTTNILLGAVNGLWQFNGKNFQRTDFHNKTLETRINDLLILDNRDIIIATLGKGIFRIDSSGRMRHVSVKDGLLSNLINCIYTLPGDSITWVGTNRGLSQLRWFEKNDSIEILNFTEFNGLNSNEITALNRIEDFLLIGTAKGINSMAIDNNNTLKKSPLINLKSVFVNGVQKPDSSMYYLSRGNFVRVAFDGISMSSKGNMSYRYRIKGLDNEWQTISNRHIEFKLYTPGTYELEICAINTHGMISQNRLKQKFVLLPEYWQTWWFKIGTALFLVGLISFVFKQRYKIEQRHHSLKIKSLETEQEALSSQITPHFLFNSLNSIQNLYQKGDAKEAVVHLANFSWLMRRILHNVKLHSISLSEEVETIRLYLELEVLRFGDRVNYSITIDPAIDADFVRIPPMLIQPFLENSIWHGILNKKQQKGEIQINFFGRGDYLIVEILDDGVGRKKAQQYKQKKSPKLKSTGLKSIDRRMTVLNQMRQTNLHYTMIDLTDKKGNAIGTKVVIQIPLDYE